MTVSDAADIAAWRERIFAQLLAVVRVLGFVAALPSATLAAYQGLWGLALLDACALSWILVLWRMTHWRYTVRVLNFLALLLLVGVGLMTTVGAVSLTYLMAPAVLAAILLGTRPALATLGVSAACILGLGLSGHSQLTVPALAHEHVLSALAVTLNFVCVGALLTLTCGTLLKGLSSSLDDVRTAAGRLEAKRARLQALNAGLRLTSAALAGLSEIVLIAEAVDEPGATQPIIFANAAFERRTGYRAEEVVGRSMRLLHGPDTDPAVVERIVAAMMRHEPMSAELVNYTRAGEPYWVEMRMEPFASAGGPVTHWVVVGRDITERRHSADAIHRLAFYDVLTGLPNRRLLMERLDVLAANAHAGRGLGAALYVDLDKFKHVNDARGHATGDALLRQAAARLSGAVRKGDTVARLGGDEFVVLLEGLGTDPARATAAALALAEAVRAALAQPVEIDGQVYHASASIGVALPLRAGHTVSDLLREADTAMYHAKAAGCNGVALFETTMLAVAERTLTLERDLAQALHKGELALHLQLQVDHDGAAVGAEALLRWRRADGILVPPDVFIPIAEASGLIVPLGQWVLREACGAWHALAAAGHALPLSVNVSPREFRQPDFVAAVRAILEDSGVPPSGLIFEVTEGLLVDDLDETAARMRELAQLGIRFSIDDFGTGYSNLAYLRKMPLHELKIDKGFMRDTPHDSGGTAIVQSILAMAGHLGLRVVAEGIETAEQAAFLADHGKPHMQGYLYCRPLPLADLIARLTRDEVALA